MENTEKLHLFLVNFQEEFTGALKEAIKNSPGLQTLQKKYNNLLDPLGYKMLIDWNFQIILKKKSPKDNLSLEGLIPPKGSES